LARIREFPRPEPEPPPRQRPWKKLAVAPIAPPRFLPFISKRVEKFGK
jgi:hypothetical protein